MPGDNVVIRLPISLSTSRISTGLGQMDDRLGGGYDRGSLVVLAAPPGAGKSILAMSMGLNQYLIGKLNVQYWSLEMTHAQFWFRALANVSSVPYCKVRNAGNDPDLREQLVKAQESCEQFGRENKIKFSVLDVQEADFTPLSLETRMGQGATAFTPDVLFVDSANLFYSGDRPAWEQLQETHRYFKIMSKRINGVVVLVHQTSREWLGFAEYCDYLIQWHGIPNHDNWRTVELELAKARHTVTQKFTVKFDLEHMKVV